MSDYSPPRLSRPVTVGVTVFLALAFAYAVLIAQQPLLGLFPAFVAGFLYVVWRFLAVLEAIADALQRIADDRE